MRDPGVTSYPLWPRQVIELSRSALPLSAGARRKAAYQVPVTTLALSGLEDRCINTQVFAKMMLPQDFPGGLEVAQVPEAGHFLHQEQPDAVNKLLLNWLAKHKECPFGCSLFAHCRTNVNRVDQRLTGSPPSPG
jgi:pimeloyl-ACP methyl ester carboxylesterase